MQVWGICNQPHLLLWALSHSTNLSADVFPGWAGKYVANGCTRRDWLKWWSGRRCRKTILKEPPSALIRKLVHLLLQLPNQRSRRKTQKDKLRKKKLCPVLAGLLWATFSREGLCGKNFCLIIKFLLNYLKTKQNMAKYMRSVFPTQHSKQRSHSGMRATCPLLYLPQNSKACFKL